MWGVCKEFVRIAGTGDVDALEAHIEREIPFFIFDGSDFSMLVDANRRAASDAIERGDKPMIEYLLRRERYRVRHNRNGPQRYYKTFGTPTECVYHAALNGQLEIVKFFHEMCGEDRDDGHAMYAAVHRNHLSIATFLFENGWPRPPRPKMKECEDHETKRWFDSTYDIASLRIED